MSFDCKNHCSNCVVCNRAKPSRQGSASFVTLGCPWEVVGMDFVADLPKSSKLQYTAILILVFHLTKMAHFVPCHKEITVEETTNLLMTIARDFMAFLKSLSPIEIPALLVNFSNLL